MRFLSLIAILSLWACTAQAAPVPTTAPTTADHLAAAKKAGRTVFLLVSDPRAVKVEAMRASATEASRLTPGSRVVEMDRSNRANRSVVKLYGLAGAKTPFVLVVAHNGAPAGGASPGKKAAEQLRKLVPSPRKADTLLALFQRKAVFVVVARADLPGQPAVLEACRKAAAALNNKAAIVRVDLADVAEKAFLDQLGADYKATGVVVHVYGLSGLKTDIVKGSITTDALLTAAKKKQQCCPTGKCG
jgi:hypothetical protein